MRYRYILKEVFDHDDFKSSYQEEAIEKILEGKYKNYIVNMATQGGKSLCYQLPGILKTKGFTVVISPSLALINDQKNYLNSLGIGAVTINGNVQYPERDQIRACLKSNRSKIRFLFLTPEIIAKNGIMRAFLIKSLQNDVVNYIVVDDAHKIIDAGGYRKSFAIIKSLRAFNGQTPWIALTTISPCDLLAKKLGMKNPLILSSSSVRENIFYDSIMDFSIKSLINFYNMIKRKERKIPSGIIFCRTYAIVWRVLSLLKKYPNLAKAYKNQQTVEEWRNGEFPILVATGEKFGYGISFQVPTIRFVVHVGMPENLRSFYHESGRAGNDGNKGYSRVYGKDKSINSLSYPHFIKYHQSSCKKQYLTQFFGENIKKCLKSCDTCKKLSA